MRSTSPHSAKKHLVSSVLRTTSQRQARPRQRHSWIGGAVLAIFFGALSRPFAIAQTTTQVPLDDNLVWIYGAAKVRSVHIPGEPNANLTPAQLNALSSADHTADYSYPIEESEGIMVGSHLYEIGGQINGANYTCTRNVYCYDAGLNTWTYLLDMPRGFSHAGFAYDSQKNTVYIVGGYQESDPTKANSGKVYASTQVLEFTPSSSDTAANFNSIKFTAGPPLPVTRAAGMAVVVGRTLYFAGGSTLFRHDPGVASTPGNYSSVTDGPNTWALDLDNPSAGWVQEATLTFPRNHVGGVSLNGKMWMVAGQQSFDSTAQLSTRVDSFDPTYVDPTTKVQTGLWSRENDLVAPARSHCYSCTFLADNRIIIAGGICQNTSSNVISYFDPTKVDSTTGKLGVWAALPNMPGGDTFSTGGWYNDSTIVIGGYQGSALLGVNVIPPSHVATKVNSNGSTLVSWTNNAKNATGSQIERSSNPLSEWQVVGNVAANIASYTDTTTLPGVNYTFRVRSTIVLPNNTNVGLSRPSNNDAPVNLQESINGNSISLSWNASSGAHLYTIRGSNVSGSYTGPILGTTTTQSFSYTLPSSATASQYYVVTSTDGTGKESNYSAEVGGPLTALQLGSTSNSGESLNPSTYNISANTGSIGSTKDSASFLLYPWSNDGIFTAQISYANNGDNSSKLGLVFRSSTSATAAESFVGLAPQTSSSVPAYTSLITRAADGGTAQSSLPTTTKSASWYRLIRSGNSLSAETSPDGKTWSAIVSPTGSSSPSNPVTLSPGSTAGYVGIAAAGGDESSFSGEFHNLVFFSTPTATQVQGAPSLDWSESYGAVTYSVQRSSSATVVPSTTIASNLLTKNFTDTTAPAGKNYYTVTAYNASGIGTVSPIISANSSISTAPPTPPPAAPTLTVPANIVVLATAPAAGSTAAPSATVTFAVTATDSNGKALTPTTSISSGTSLSVGVTTVTASATDLLGQKTTKTFTITVNPPAPQIYASNINNLGSSNLGLTLSWATYSGPSGYNVKRTNAAGTTVTLVSPSNPVYTDYSETGTTTYVVTALLGSYESGPSNQITLTPASSTLGSLSLGLSTPTSVSYTPSTAAYTLGSQGGSLNGTQDSGNLVLLPWTGDGIFTARLLAAPSGPATARSGLVFRASAAANAAERFVGYASTTPATTTLIDRASTGATATTVAGTAPAAALPVWYRLIKTGTALAAQTSPNGTSWQAVGTSSSPAISNGAVGLINASGSAGQVGSTFDNVVFFATPRLTTSGNSNTLDWSESVGAVSYSVQRLTSSTGTPTTIASKLTTTNFTDTTTNNAVPYFYTVTAIDAAGVATVSPVISTSPTPLPAPVLAALPGNKQVTLSWTAIPNAASYVIQRGTSPTGTLPTIATGVTPTSYIDSTLTNGTNYYYIVTASPGSAGPAGRPSTTVESTPINLLGQDLGSPSPAGTFTNVGGTLTFSSGGSDIFLTSDSFHYVYQPWSGDGVWIAHIQSLDDTNAWTKFGLMFRSTLDPASPNAFVLQSAQHGAQFTYRSTSSGFTTRPSNGTGSAPNWLKLERVGNNFSAFTSSDGVTWTSLLSDPSTISIPMATSGYIGFALTSHDDGTIAHGVIDHHAFLVSPTNLRAGTPTTTSVALNWTNNTAGNQIDTTAMELDYTLSGGTTWTPFSTNLLPTATSGVITGLGAGTAYDFRVKALDGTLSSDVSSLFKVTTAPLSPNNNNNNSDGGAVISTYNPGQQSGGTTTLSNPGAGGGTFVASTSAPGSNQSFSSVTNPGTVVSYSTWAAAFGVQGATDTPQNDGVPNGLKYLVGINPATPISSADRLLLPTLGVDQVGTSNYLTLTFQQSPTAAATITLEQSTDLKMWNPVTTTLYSKISTADPNSGRTKVELGAPLKGQRQFIRLKITPS